MEKQPIRSHEDLEVYKLAFDVAMRIFELSKTFPVEERYSLTDQIRRSSRSVCANLAEAWRTRGKGAGGREQGRQLSNLPLHPAPNLPCLFCEAEAAETQTWLKFAVKCNYLNAEAARELYSTYNRILSILVTIINNPSPWIIKR